MNESRPSVPPLVRPKASAVGVPQSDTSGGDPAGRVAPPIAARHYLWLLGAASVVTAMLHWLGGVLTPFLVGAILAFLGSPIVAALERRRVPRALGTLLVILLFGVAIAALFLILVPLIQAEVSLVARRLPDLVGQLVDDFLPLVAQNLGMPIALDLETLKSAVASNLESVRELGLRLLSGVRAGGALLLSLVINLALIPVVMFYMLRDWNMLIGRIDELVPRRWQESVRTIAAEVHVVLSEFLHGQMLVMLVLATYYAIALSVAGLERAIAIGVLTGLLVFIPYVGFGIGLTLGMIAALLQWNGWPGFIAVLVVYGAGQLLENYVLLPYLVGDRIGLHPLAVIFALMAFGQLFGFAGVLLALPLAAVLLVGLRHLRGVYAQSPLYREA